MNENNRHNDKIKTKIILLRNHHSIAPIFHYSMVDKETQHKNFLYLHLNSKLPDRL